MIYINSNCVDISLQPYPYLNKLLKVDGINNKAVIQIILIQIIINIIDILGLYSSLTSFANPSISPILTS